MSALAQKQRADLARAISAVENAEGGQEDLIRAGYERFAAMRIVGVTGPPGSGKSTMVDVLSASWAAQGRQTAVIAVDPSSPFSGGAILGDRFRMRRAEERGDIFIRSVAARGHPGGLGAAVPDICIVLAAFGFQRVLIETVGSGQTDVDIKDHADTVVVTLVPGLGDSMQAAKAGIMEIGDIFAVNKADLPGADRVRSDIEAMLHLAYQPLMAPVRASARRLSRGEQMLKMRHGAADGAPAWQPPVVSLSATAAEGVEGLSDAIGQHLAWLEGSGRFVSHRLTMQRAQLGQRVWRELRSRLEERRAGDLDQLTHWATQILSAQASVSDAVSAILDGGEHIQPAKRKAGQEDSRPDGRMKRRLES
ncbi:MAG TPA: methylmalonyl Co-A mutase-associated GTPase MeaB [Candidatus Polarisedimenticolia bacterium]|nr:methylmalonyl Co-A mutase-associated GTPase MeaB [Candidatus Polarisedimenticolia bacterium]